MLNPHLDIFKGEAIKKAKAVKEIESKEEINQNEEKLLNYDDIQNLFGHPLDEVVAVKKETEKIAEPEEMKIEKTKKGFSILWGAIKVNW